MSGSPINISKTLYIHFKEQYITSSDKLMFPKQTSISFTDTTFDEHFGAYSLLPTTISAVQNVSEQIYHDNCRKSPIENVIDKSSTEELIFWFITRRRSRKKTNIFDYLWNGPFSSWIGQGIHIILFSIVFCTVLLFCFWYFWVLMTICMKLYQRPKSEFW